MGEQPQVSGHLTYYLNQDITESEKQFNKETLETQVWSLDWEDALKQEMATNSCTLAWKILWTEEPGRLQSMGLQELNMT